MGVWEGPCLWRNKEKYRQLLIRNPARQQKVEWNILNVVRKMCRILCVCVSHIWVYFFPAFLFLIINLFLLVFNLPTYRKHSVLIPSSAPLSARHPFTPSPRSPPLPPPLVRFPEFGVFMFVSLSDISYPFLLPSLLFPFTSIYIPQMNETI